MTFSFPNQPESKSGRGSFYVVYRFRIQDGTLKEFNLRFDNHTLDLIGNSPQIVPQWTRLDFFKCPNCPLWVEISPHCPLAFNLVNIVKSFNGLISYDTIQVEVLTQERLLTQETSAQKGLSSMMGLVMAASGCPHTAFFKPMARFHLPLASEEETIFRATAMYLLAQYFRREAGQKAELELDGLHRIYREIQIINQMIARRLRAAADSDSTINAVILLDIYAQTLPMAIEKSLEEIRFLFDSFL